MSEIKVFVKPVFEVFESSSFEEEDSLLEKSKVQYCFNCGSPLMYILTEYIDNNIAFTWYCAVCGKCQRGCSIPSSRPKKEMKK